VEKNLKDLTSHAADVHAYAALVEEQITNKESEVYQQEP